MARARGSRHRAAGGAGREPGLIGRVAGLYLRTSAAPVQQRRAIAGEDLSPRQWLIAGTPAYARLALPPNALRENLLLDVDSAMLASGQLLTVGPSAVFRMMFACEPCGKLNLHQAQLSRTIGAQRGMLARVVHGGDVAVGDAVHLLAERLPAWSDDWRVRVETVLRRVPPGMVVEYRQLALLAGVALTYCRVFPRVARAIGLADRAVPLRSANPAPRWDGAGLFD